MPFGESRRYCKERAEKAGGITTWYHEVYLTFRIALNHILDLWQLKNVSFSTLIKLPEDEYRREKASLLDMLEERMMKYKKSTIETGTLEWKEDVVTGGLERHFKTVTGASVS